MASLEAPRLKYPKIESDGNPSDGLTNFLYFGLMFIWEEVFLKEPFHFCYSFNDRQIPSRMTAAIKEDLLNMKHGDFPKFTPSAKLGSFLNVEGTNVWLYQHECHAPCSSVLFEHFRCHRSANTVQTDCGSMQLCLQTHNSFHFILEPYFRDNKSLIHLYNALADAGKGQEREVAGNLAKHLTRLFLLKEPKPDDVPDYFYTGGAALDVVGYIFNEEQHVH